MNRGALSCFKGTMRRHCPLQAWKGLLEKMDPLGLFLYFFFKLLNRREDAHVAAEEHRSHHGGTREGSSVQTRQNQGENLPFSFHPRAGSHLLRAATVQAPRLLNPAAWAAGAGHGDSHSHGQQSGMAALSEDK